MFFKNDVLTLITNNDKNKFMKTGPGAQNMKTGSRTLDTAENKSVSAKYEFST
jgi:hypothetical protein